MTESWGLTMGFAVIAGAALGVPAIPLVLAVVLALQLLRGRVQAVVLVLAATCAVIGALRVAFRDDPPIPVDIDQSEGAVIEIESLPRSSASGVSVLASVRALVFDGDDIEVEPATVLVRFPDGERVSPGDVMTVVWSAESLEMLAPGYGRYVKSRGAGATAYVWWFRLEEEGPSFHRGLVSLRQQVSAGLLDVLPGDAGALAAGIVTGDDSALQDSTRDAFLGTGTTHITAVSGSNVAMVLAIWNLAIPAGRNRRLLAVQVLVIVSIWLYALLVGLEPPAIRAAIMASLILLASRAGRRADLMTLLGLTSAGMVLWDPDHVRMVAFWLSVVATAAIILRVPSEPGTGLRSAGRGVLEGVALAQLATLPIILVTFGTWSLTSIVANAILSPLMWLAFPLCFALAAIAIVAPWLASFVAIVPLIPLELSLAVVRSLSTVVPPLDMQNAGQMALVAIGAPCAIGVAILARDTQRWAVRLRRMFREQPVHLAAAILGPALGVLTAMLLATLVG